MKCPKLNRQNLLLLSFWFVLLLFFALSVSWLDEIRESIESAQEEGNAKMPMATLDATVPTFDSVFERFRSEAPKYKANFILFLADKDPSTQLSWCPDCVRAEPVIYKTLVDSPGNVALLTAYVGDRPTWRNPLHPWRTDSRFKLKGVPTLLLWEDDAIKGRLEDYEADKEPKIKALLAAAK